MRPILVFAMVGALLGVLLVAFSSPFNPAYAQDLPPRPPTPTPAPTATPTATPAPPAEPEPERDSRPTPGAITGTVIDLNTGAPAPNVAVRVADLIVISDANGNYGRGYLPPGAYEVALALPADWGTPAQGTLIVTVRSDETTIQHLFFRRAVP